MLFDYSGLIQLKKKTQKKFLAETCAELPIFHSKILHILLQYHFPNKKVSFKYRHQRTRLHTPIFHSATLGNWQLFAKFTDTWLLTCSCGQLRPSYCPLPTFHSTSVAERQALDMCLPSAVAKCCSSRGRKGFAIIYMHSSYNGDTAAPPLYISVGDGALCETGGCH